MSYLQLGFHMSYLQLGFHMSYLQLGFQVCAKADFGRATEEEKIKLWPTICGVYPDYQAYQERTQRNIPVFICTPLEDDE